MTKDLGDEWLCSPPPPPGLAKSNESDRPPEASTAWSDEAEAVLRTEVAGQRHKFAAVHWGRAATAVAGVTTSAVYWAAFLTLFSSFISALPNVVYEKVLKAEAAADDLVVLSLIHI